MKKYSKPFLSHNRGLSLIELLIALVILVLATAAGYSSLKAGITRLENIYQSTMQEGDVAFVFATLGKDLRCATLSDENPDLTFSGHQDEATLGSNLLFYRTSTTENSDIFETVVYSLKRQQNSNRFELNRQYKGQESILCSNVLVFKVKYSNGQEWRADWGWDNQNKRPLKGIRGLPLLISVHLETADEKNNHLVTEATLPIMIPLLNKNLHA